MSRALGLALGFAADQLFADPRRGHPVAGFGQLAAALEHRTYDDSRPRGVAFTALLVGGATAIGLAAERATRDHPVAHTAATAAATWTVLGGASLAREARAVQARLDADDLDGARVRVTHLVGRDPRALDREGVTRAVVESVAENTSDAVVTPLVWGAVAGVPGLLAHRAANTLDAMVGHHTERYERFGWASARLDDVLGLPGARLTALLAGLTSGHPRRALRAWRRDAPAHPSPNAGPVEAAFAGALGVRLGGETVYPHRVEQRPVLGDGPRPSGPGPAIRLAQRVGWAALAIAVAHAAASETSWTVWTSGPPFRRTTTT